MTTQQKAESTREQRDFSQVENALDSIQKLFAHLNGEEKDFDVHKKKTREYIDKEDHKIRIRESETVMSNSEMSLTETERRETVSYKATGLRIVTKESATTLKAGGIEAILLQTEVLSGMRGEELTPLISKANIHINLSNE